MEAFGRSALYLCLVLLILTEVSSKYIHVPSEVCSGTEGSPLLLSVETSFSLDEAEVQGTWSHIKLSGTSTPLITFTNNNEITEMTYDNRLLFQRSNFSLLIQKLKQEDEGQYQLSLNIKFHNRKGNVIQAKGTIHVLVHVPVSTPLIDKSPLNPVIEDKANVTWTCSVERGTRVVFQWLKDDVALTPSKRYKFNQDNSTLLISPVRKEDKGTYRCVASNAVSKSQYSRAVELIVYYGPYNLEVNSRQSLWTSGVFTINPGELVFFECQADSNPPNSYVWISKNHNRTEIITEGPRLEVQRYTLAQAEEYLCRAFNNMTQKQDETQFTLVVAKFKTGKEKHTQGGASWSPLAVILVCSSFIIGCLLLFFIRRTCHPKRVLMSVYKRPFIDQQRPHRSGHEDASEDFGIYEFVSIPGKMESTQASSRSLARLESVQDMHTTIYDVIRHVPESPSQSLLN